jgi:hypothetical protein
MKTRIVGLTVAAYGYAAMYAAYYDVTFLRLELTTKVLAISFVALSLAPYVLGLVGDLLRRKNNRFRSQLETAAFIAIDVVSVYTFCFTRAGGYNGLEFDLVQILRFIVYSLILVVEGSFFLAKTWSQPKARKKSRISP